MGKQLEMIPGAVETPVTVVKPKHANGSGNGKSTAESSLVTAKAKLEAQMEAGATCPCCGQFAKVYKRTITSIMARALIRMHRTFEDKEFHAPTELHKAGLIMGGDFAKLEHWGLVERELGNPTGGAKFSGWWKLTDLGKQFVKKQHTIPRYAHIYNGECLGFSGEKIYIEDSLGKHFSYQELMSR
jgi:hypothetical protein